MDYYFYNATIGSFQRCQTNPNKNCLRCTAFEVCIKYISNSTDFSTEIVNAVEKTGEIVGQAQNIAEKSGISIALFAILFNIRFSEPLVKAIQIIVLFDKLRLVNVNFDGGLLGYFLEKVFSAFEENFIKTDDYITTARIGHNKMYERKVQVIAYRRKVDKFIIFTLNIFVELILIYRWK